MVRENCIMDTHAGQRSKSAIEINQLKYYQSGGGAPPKRTSSIPYVKYSAEVRTAVLNIWYG